MSADWAVPAAGGLLFTLGTLAAWAGIPLLKRRRRVGAARRSRLLAALLAGDAAAAGAGRDARGLLDAYIQLRQTVARDSAAARRARDVLLAAGADRDCARGLDSRSRLRRLEAATRLGYLGTPLAVERLQAALGAERDAAVRLHVALALCETGSVASLPALVAAARRGSPWFFERVAPLLCGFGRPLFLFLRASLDDPDERTRDLAVRLAAEYPAAELRAFLLRTARGPDADAAVRAAASLGRLYPHDLGTPEFLGHPDPAVRAHACRALGRFPGRDALGTLLAELARSAKREAAALAAGDAREAMAARADCGVLGETIGTVMRRDAAILDEVTGRFVAERDPAVIAALAEVLSTRIEHFFFLLVSNNREEARVLLVEILAGGDASDTIGFLHRNRDPLLEAEILDVLRAALPRSRRLERELRVYLAGHLLERLGLARIDPAAAKPPPRAETGKTVALVTLLAAAVAAVAGWFLLARGPLLTALPAVDLVRLAAHDGAWMLGWYALALNGVCLGLLALSFLGVRAQRRAWAAKPVSLLFRPGILPSVTVIAPAYREEATITESVNSLLNLQYPDYELVVVNDGSTDETLNVLIAAFKLERVDRLVPDRLATMPVRGIYLNPALPRLVVVDKDNGGKADSLNAGINVATKEYFCGIDADSLLEPDALLRLASRILDTERETVAAGGNILPVNGCRVGTGVLHETRVPRRGLARFQAAEYLRSFLSGRVGWAQMGSLLIVSGAFGLFRVSRVVEIGGYLTASERYRKDTVGEDMELVVRLRRHMLESGRPHAVHYAFDANCWTEVPETLSVLHRQRDRWHRGLLDIAWFHRRLFFRARYRQVGLVAFPYFLLFEILGPFFELFGMALVPVAALLGMLDLQLAAFLFLTTVLMGVFVSAASFLLLETERDTFPVRDYRALLGSVVLESFGFRQLVSLWRISGYFSAMKGKGWGTMVRRGFAGAPPAGAGPVPRAVSGGQQVR